MADSLIAHVISLPNLNNAIIVIGYYTIYTSRIFSELAIKYQFDLFKVALVSLKKVIQNILKKNSRFKNAFAIQLTTIDDQQMGYASDLLKYGFNWSTDIPAIKIKRNRANFNVSRAGNKESLGKECGFCCTL